MVKWVYLNLGVDDCKLGSSGGQRLLSGVPPSLGLFPLLGTDWCSGSQGR